MNQLSGRQTDGLLNRLIETDGQPDEWMDMDEWLMENQMYDAQTDKGIR